MNWADLIGTIIGFVLTLVIFSYILGDNVLFRLVIHIFIGVSAGYAAVMAWYSVIWPQMIVPFFIGSIEERLLVIIPLILSLFLLLKAFPRLSGWGSPILAFLVGVGAATAIGGAVMGTMVPQVLASMNLLDERIVQQSGITNWVQVANASIILVGMITTLVYFNFSVRSGSIQPSQKDTWIEGLSWVGQVFIAITFGVLFSGVYMAALTALISRLTFLVNAIISIVQL
jgi:hypothetical protein